MEGAGFDEVANCFCLSEIEASRKEGALGEFAGFGEAGSAGDALAEEVVEEDREPWEAISTTSSVV